MMNAEKIMMNVEGKFWTRQNEMVAELEELDYEVVAISGESLTVVDLHDDDETEYVLYLGRTNSTMWIESAEET